MRKRPSAWLYLLAILLPIGGCVGSISMAASGLGGLHEKLDLMPRAKLPGDAEVALARGPALLMYETRARDGGASYQTSTASSDDSPAPLGCTLRGPDGHELRLESPHGSTSYTFDGRSARSLYLARVPERGTYHLSCTYTDAGASHAGSDDHVVFFTGSIVAIIGKVFAPALLGVIGGITLALVVFFSRRRADA